MTTILEYKKDSRFKTKIHKPILFLYASTQTQNKFKKRFYFTIAL